MKTEPLSLNGPAGRLEARLHLPDGEFRGTLAICHPHPQYGGSMYNNVVDAIVEGALSAGLAALRFNFRGVGRSDGDYDGGNGELEDAKAAVDDLRSNESLAGLPVRIAGYSFGGGIALRTFFADDSISSALLVAPGVSGIDPPTNEVRPYLLIVGSEDRMTASASSAGWLTDPAHHQLLQGADHFFGGFESRIANLVAEFFAQRQTDE
jgi:alpha/beta superfamily hydrolase